jgi:predicted RNase H-like nuclease
VRSVLAVDPAWTMTQPSGVALLTEHAAGWSCAGVAPSYRQFLALADGASVEWSHRPPAGEPDAGALLGAAGRLSAGVSVDVVAVDMPISTVPVTGRRAAENELSRTFATRGCATHSPNERCPGPVGRAFSEGFAAHGYQVATTATPGGATPVAIEVYPHTTLLALLGADYRVPYKISRSGGYWPDLSPPERRRRIVRMWRTILRRLGQSIDGIAIALPRPADAAGTPARVLKRYEDALDAVICGWAAVEYLEGRCTAYGDSTGAIWTP